MNIVRNNDEIISNVENNLEVFYDESVGNYHTNYNNSGYNWWDCYCMGRTLDPTPKTIDQIISTCCLNIHETRFDGETEVKHREKIKNVFENRVYNLVVCRCGCCHWAHPKILFLSKSQ